MPARKLYIEFDESVAQGAAVAARHSGMSLSEWINAAARHVLEDGYFELDVSDADDVADDVDAADDVGIDIEDEVPVPVFADNGFLYVAPTTAAADDVADDADGVTPDPSGELDTLEIEGWLDVESWLDAEDDSDGDRPPADDEHQASDEPTDDRTTDDRSVGDESAPVLDDQELVWADAANAQASDDAGSDEAGKDEAANDETDGEPDESDDISQLELLFAGEPEPVPDADAPAADES